MADQAPDLRRSALANTLVVLLLAILLPLLGRAPSASSMDQTPDTRPWGCRTCAIPMPTPDAPPVVPNGLGGDAPEG
jgi:hypothetical protein